MDANKFCKLHTDYMIDTMVEYEDYSKSIYAKGLGEIDLSEGEDFNGNECLNCGKKITDRKVYCNYTCSTEHKRKNAPMGICEHCGKEFRRWPTSKVTCGQSCSQLRTNAQRAEFYRKKGDKK